LEIKALHTQPGCAWSDAQVAAVAQAMVEFAAWHGTPVVRFAQANSAAWVKRLRAAIKASNISWKGPQ